MKASLIYLGPIGNIMFNIKLWKDWTESVQRSQWKVEGKASWFGDVFCSRSWASYTATWQSECKCLLEPSSTTCAFFPTFITQSATNFHTRQCPLSHSKTGKAVSWSWKHCNNEMTSPESWSKPNRKPLENPLQQSYGQETHFSHWTMEETGRRVEKNHTRAVQETSDVLWLQMCWSHSKQGPVH